MEILQTANISGSVKHTGKAQMRIFSSCTLSAFLNTLKSRNVKMLQGDVCISLHFRNQKTMQHGKGKARLAKAVCFMLELYMLFFFFKKYRFQAVTDTHRSWHCSASLKSSPDKLSSWLLPFKMAFECDSFKITEEFEEEEQNHSHILAPNFLLRILTFWKKCLDKSIPPAGYNLMKKLIIWM